MVRMKAILKTEARNLLFSFVKNTVTESSPSTGSDLDLNLSYDTRYRQQFFHVFYPQRRVRTYFNTFLRTSLALICILKV